MMTDNATLYIIQDDQITSTLAFNISQVNIQTEKKYLWKKTNAFDPNKIYRGTPYYETKINLKTILTSTQAFQFYDYLDGVDFSTQKLAIGYSYQDTEFMYQITDFTKLPQDTYYTETQQIQFNSVYLVEYQLPDDSSQE